MTFDITESISAHNSLANYYEFRHPYNPKIFEGLISRFKLNKNSTILDICCGTGELASNFAPLVKTVYAIDGSEAMLQKATKKENIVYSLIDVNKNLFVSPEKVDMFVIGRAIRWINANSLINLIQKNLKPQGLIVILNTKEIRNTSWHPLLNNILKKYNRTSNNLGKVSDSVIMEKMPKHKYDLTISEKQKFSRNLNHIVMHLLSSTYGLALKNLEDNIDQFRLDLSNALSNHSKNDFFTSEIETRALIFKPT